MSRVSYKILIKPNTSVVVRESPNMNSGIVATLTEKDNENNIYVTEKDNDYFYIPQYNGWVLSSLVKKVNLSTNAVMYNIQEKIIGKKKEKSVFDKQVEEYIQSTDVIDPSKITTKSLEGILGVPYQFMDTVDRRIPGTEFGRTYADRIVSRMPLLLLTPGRVNFMKNYKSKNDAALTIMNLIENATPGELNDGVKNIGRYYTFDIDYVEYYDYVNTMMSAGARFLNIQDVKIKCNGKYKKIGEINWMKMGQNSYKSILSTKEYIAFYIDSANSVSETFSNSSTASQLASKVNDASSIAKELQFITGLSGSKIGAAMLDKDAQQTALNKIDDIADKYLHGSQLFKDIASNFSTVALGGKLLFPEIWDDSEFSKDYDVNIKLRSPDKDPVSWYLNIYRPLTYLICMTAPKQADNPNGYISPFLIRAFYKGLFNCDMGLITSLSISKGRESAWTLEGLPTEVDVSLTIKDLYGMLSITREQDAGNFVNNICLVSYIANMCGVNINEPDFERMVDIYIMLSSNKYKHIPNKIWSNVTQDFANRLEALEEDVLKYLK